MLEKTEIDYCLDINWEDVSYKMKIVVCSSLDFTYKIQETKEKLEKEGHEVIIPLNAKKIIDGEITFEKYKRVKESQGDSIFRKMAGTDLIKRYFGIIRDSDCILVVNERKKGIDGYIGGNTLLEMGFAYVLGKKIYLLNNIPWISYTDEIEHMNPIILNGNLSKIS